MYLRMKRHGSRSDSASHQFLMRVPADVADRVQGRVVTIDLPGSGRDPAVTVNLKLGQFAKVSLRTRDAATADLRRLVVTGHLAKIYDAARNGPATLSHREVVSLSGEVYRRLRSTHDENPGSPAQWAAWKAFTRAALEGRLLEAPTMSWGPYSEEEAVARVIFEDDDMTAGVNAVKAETYDETALRERCGRLAMWVLAEHGIEPDGPSYLALLREVAKAALQAGWQLKRQASGDYSPDPMENRFPPIKMAGKAANTLTLPGLFTKWEMESKPAGSTLTTWRGVVDSLVRHLGHDDARRLTADDVVAWKDALVSGKLTRKPLSPKTINDTYLACLRALLSYGVTNKLLSENVAHGVKVSARRRAGERKLPYTEDEVGRLLQLASAETLPARRWLPLLQASCGARIGELAQIWGEHVKIVDDVPCIELRPAPDGGSFKNEGSERTIPLHPAVIKMGFLDFVAAKGRGPLFYGKSRRRDAARHASKGVSNHLAAWIRDQGFDDPRKPPTHALRHRFKTAASRFGVADSMADALQGHTDRSTAGVYRHVSLADMAQAIAKIPVPVKGQRLAENQS